MADKKKTEFNNTTVNQKKTDEYYRKEARDKADSQKTKEYTAQNERDIQAGKKQAQSIHKDALGGDENAKRTEKKTKEIRLLASQSGNMAAIDKMIASQD